MLTVAVVCWLSGFIIIDDKKAADTTNGMAAVAETMIRDNVRKEPCAYSASTTGHTRTAKFPPGMEKPPISGGISCLAATWLPEESTPPPLPDVPNVMTSPKSDLILL